MTMATIAENLQTIKDSVGDIKQAIIDKGGTISGDITTWASAIDGIQTGGGGSDTTEQVVFNCKIDDDGSLVGSLNYLPTGYDMIYCVYFDNDFSTNLVRRNAVTDAQYVTLGLNFSSYEDYYIYAVFLIKWYRNDALPDGVVDLTQESIPVKLNFI
jgi:hypothetical protein